MKPTLILTANPDFTDEALAELKKAQPNATILGRWADGVWAVYLANGFFPLAERWRKRPPIFVRHICPAMITIPANGDLLAALQTTLQGELIDLFDPALPFSVQTRVLVKKGIKPFDVNKPLSNTIQETGAKLNVRAPKQVLSVVIGEEMAALGVSPVTANLSDWAGGVRRFAREKGQISRAEFKLLEALEWFRITLPSRGIALDLGAAPGGWTRVLRQREQYVTAVDPANLHPSLSSDNQVRHLRVLAEDYLKQYPDKFDIIVNDMRLDARDSARLMVSYAPYLYPHGVGIMTFKLPTKNRHSAIDHALNILRKGYKIGGARHLFHNRSEITVYLKRRV